LNYLLAKEGFRELVAPEDYRRLGVQLFRRVFPVARATPNRFAFSGPDRTVKMTVYNGPPDGGTSNSVSLGAFAKGSRRKRNSGTDDPCCFGMDL
jgi:hypothetical protein